MRRLTFLPQSWGLAVRGWLRVCLLGLFCLFSLVGGPVFAQAPGSTPLGVEMSFWRDTSGQTLLKQVQSPSGQALFNRWDPSRGELNLGYSPDPHWIRLQIDKPAGVGNFWVLEVPFHGLREVDIYLPDGRTVQAGNARQPAPEQLEHRFLAVPVTLQGGVNVLYLRVKSQSTLTVPVRLWLPRDFLAHVQSSTVLQAMYFGGLAAMTLYNLFLAVSLRDRRFVGYVLFAVTLGLGMLSGNGYGQLYLWSDAGRFDDIAQTLFLCFAAACSVDFSRAFLQLKRSQPVINRWLWAGQCLMVVYAGLLLASLVLGFALQLIYQALSITVLALGVLIIQVGWRSLRQGVHGVRFFMLAWSVLWLGVFVATFRMLGWLPSNPLTMYGIQIASAAEMLLLALALADIVHQERSERDVAQSLALRLKEDMVLQLRQSEDRLEQAVQDRTQQLRQSLSRQRELLDQYVRFGALISHEFRNPLGIIQSQASLLRKMLGSRLEEAGKRLDIISATTQRLSQLFDRWLQGGKLHSLGDKLDLQELDLSTWLQDLLASHPHYAVSHTLRTDFTDLDASALVMADESLLEIAVLNLLDNACKYSPSGSQVRLFFKRQGPMLGLVIDDQGSGIAPEHHASIFDEYVRLQPEGPVRGIGLGLALVKRIADLLGGFMDVQSTPGQGSTFCLWLPVATQSVDV